MLTSLSVGLIAAGAGWFLLSLMVPGFIYAGLAWNLCLLVGVAVDAWLLRGCVRWTAQRICPPVLSLGVENAVSVVWENNTDLALTLRVKDEPPPDFRWDKREGILLLHPRQTGEFSYHVTPTARGDFRFGNINVRVRSRLGLVERQIVFPARKRVKVYPNILQSRKHQLLARRNQLVEMGLKRSRTRGEGTEFEALRDYVPDDELRRVDWNATARKARLVSKDFELERNQNIVIMLEAGRSMASRLEEMTKFDHAVNACAFLSYVAAQTDDRLGLLVFADELLKFLPPTKGRKQFFSILEALYPLEPRLVEPNYRLAFTFLAQSIKRRSLVVLFTDLIDPDSSAAVISHAPVLSRKHVFLCIALSDYELREIIEPPPKSADEMYRQAVAISILDDRLRALSQLSSRGVLVLDTSPKEISVATVNKYLEIKGKL